jgi:hypothetical protein
MNATIRKVIGEMQEPHPETDMSNPEEKREVVLARKIKHCIGARKGTAEDYREALKQAERYADEIITMHGQQP